MSIITGGVYAKNDILGAAMQAAITRDTVISHNISNNDTPNYKKYAVAFEESLEKAVNNYKRTGVLDLSKTTPAISRIHTTLSTRVDGNNVDINEENVQLYHNSVVYDTLVNSVIHNYKLLDMVFNNMKS